MATPTPSVDPFPTKRDPLVRRIPGAAKTGIDRATFIATLHAVANWFAEHPEIPTPTEVTMRHVSDDGVVDVTRWSDANGARIVPVRPAGEHFPDTAAWVAVLPLVSIADAAARGGPRIRYERVVPLHPVGVR